MEFSANNSYIEINNNTQDVEFINEQAVFEIENNANTEVMLDNSQTEIEFLQEGTLIVSENDHTKLKNRDVADQHPISAITGLQEALDNVKLPDNIVTEAEFDVVKEEFLKALEDKANQVDFEQAVIDFGEALDGKQPVGNYALKNEIPDVSNFVTDEEVNTLNQQLETAINDKVPLKQYQNDVNQFLSMIDAKADAKATEEVIVDVLTLIGQKQDELIAGENITIIDNVISAIGGGSSEAIEVSEIDNLIKEDNILKAYTEAGSGEITQEFIRTLNVPVEPATGSWNSYLTDSGVLLLYSNNVIVRTDDGVNFVVHTLKYVIRGMTKANENNTIYCSLPTARLYISKDDGLTFEEYVTDGLQGMTWLSIEAMNYRTANGWSSMLVMNRSARVLCYTVSTDTWVLNNNNKYTIEFMTTLGHDFWFANKNGQVCKTNTSLIFTYYADTKAGLNCIKSANGMVFCGFSDGTICHLNLEQWQFHTVAEGETVTDIKYYNGLYYVVTNGANYYTSTDLINWNKVDLISNYGGSIHFTNFGFVTVNSEANLLPSRKRIENALIDLYNKQDEITEVNQIAYSNSLFTWDYIPADTYSDWLLNNDKQYFNGTKWAKQTILFVITSDGEIYDPVTLSDTITVEKYDLVRIAYDSWGSSAPPTKIGTFAPLKELFNS